MKIAFFFLFIWTSDGGFGHLGDLIVEMMGKQRGNNENHVPRGEFGPIPCYPYFGA